MANTIRLKRGTTEPTAGDLVTGELAINTGDASVYTKLDDGTVSPVVGKSNNLFVAVRNETGSTIPAFSAVYISGVSNGKPLVSLAQADAESTSSKTLGITTTSISTNSNGEVITSGLLTKVNTTQFAAGDVLWLSGATAGGFTTTKPSAPTHAVFLGTVLTSASNGKVDVKVQNGYEIEELHNVSITTPTNGQALTYDSATGLWKNSTVSSSGGTWGSITGTLSSQSDLNTALGLKANLASPTFTGTPAAPTASAGTNTTQVATTAFVTSALTSKANLASPTFTGTPAAPTPNVASNSTQIATTAYVKTNLTSYATIASPTFTGSPAAPTAATTSDATLIATTAFVKANIRKTPSYFSGNLNSTGAFVENYAYLSNTNAQHEILLWNAGYYNSDGVVIMFKQHDDSQMNFNDGNGWTFAPNGDRYYAAFKNAVVFAVRISAYSWFIFGDLTNVQYPAYGTIDTAATTYPGSPVSSGLYDYYGSMINAYSYYSVRANGWGGLFNQNENAPYGTVMSDNFTYSSSTDTYNLLADGNGGYYYNFVSSGGGGGYDAYGTKYGTPYWDGMGLMQAIADGTGGTTYISWDGYAPYPTSGTQVGTTTTNIYGFKYDANNSGYWLYYDETPLADGSGGSYTSWTISSGYYYPYGWALDAYHVDSSRTNGMTYWYDSGYGYVYPWDYGYNGADGMGGSQWFSTSGGGSAWYPSYGTQLSSPFQEYYSGNYVYIAADGNNGFYLQN
jgi:hypothetical protein